MSTRFEVAAIESLIGFVLSCRRRHTWFDCDWSSDVCSSDLIAVEVVEEGFREDAVPSLQRLGQVGQLGDMPTFIVELSKELAEPQPGRMRRGGPLAGLVRDHARSEERRVGKGWRCGRSPAQA